MVKIDLRLVRTAIRQGTAERAHAFTEQVPGFIDVHQDSVGAPLPHHLLRTEPGKSFRSSIPVGNPPLQIGKIDTLMKVVQDQFEEEVVHQV
jgi:hypothetical protein